MLRPLCILLVMLLAACSNGTRYFDNRKDAGLQQAGFGSGDTVTTTSGCAQYSHPPTWKLERVYNNPNEVVRWLEREIPASFAHFTHRRPSARTGVNPLKFLQVQSELRIQRTAQGLLDEVFMSFPRGGKLFINDGQLFEDGGVILYVRPFEVYRSNDYTSLQTYYRLPSETQSELRIPNPKVRSDIGTYVGIAYMKSSGEFCGVDMVYWRYDTWYPDMDTVKTEAKTLFRAAVGRDSALFAHLGQ